MSKAATKVFDVSEIRVRDYHFFLREGTVTCEEIVGVYLDRIAELDKSTGLNSMVVLNPNALKRARELDAEFKSTGQLKKLHGVPAIIKDNYDTHDLQTAGGSLAMKGSLPPDDRLGIAENINQRLSGPGVLYHPQGKSRIMPYADVLIFQGSNQRFDCTSVFDVSQSIRGRSSFLRVIIL